jgi:hypothetical protein
MKGLPKVGCKNDIVSGYFRRVYGEKLLGVVGKPNNVRESTSPIHEGLELSIVDRSTILLGRTENIHRYYKVAIYFGTHAFDFFNATDWIGFGRLGVIVCRTGRLDL